MFARNNNLLEFVDVLKKGARVAQDPESFEQIESLEPQELEALKGEKLHKWKQPLTLYFTIVTCSIGAAVQ